MDYANAPAVTGPRELPGLRQWLQQQWGPGGFFSMATEFTLENDPLSLRLPHDQGRELRQFDTERIGQAGLYYVAEEIVDVVQHISAQLPPTTLTKELLPEPTGFIWLEKPLLGRPAVTSRYPDRLKDSDTIKVRAILWGPGNIQGGSVLGIATYGDLLFHDGVSLFAPLGRTDWKWGHDTEEPIVEDIADDKIRVESMAEDRRFLATLLLMMAQKNVTETEEVQPIRQARRRMERAGLTSLVRVVNVRERHRPKPPSGETRTVEWTRRWLVGWHTKQVAYGPGRSLRRPMLIAPYMKGPDDMPLVISEKVNLLKPE